MSGVSSSPLAADGRRSISADCDKISRFTPNWLTFDTIARPGICRIVSIGAKNGAEDLSPWPQKRAGSFCRC
jgi:hypothetical protein